MEQNVVLDALQKAVKGLLYLSETEAPLEPLLWEGGDLDTKRLLKLAGDRLLPIEVVHELAGRRGRQALAAHDREVVALGQLHRPEERHERIERVERQRPRDRVEMPCQQPQDDGAVRSARDRGAALRLGSVFWPIEMHLLAALDELDRQ